MYLHIDAPSNTHTCPLPPCIGVCTRPKHTCIHWCTPVEEALILEETCLLIHSGPVLALSLREAQHRPFVPWDQSSP